MRAAFFERLRTITVRDAPAPEPAPDEVLLRVRLCGICGSDLSLYKTGVLSGPDVILGHELVADVDHDPSGTWPTGARVTVYPSRGCGECLWCLEGKPRYCIDPPEHHGGGFAEHMTALRSNLIAVPDGLEDRSASVAEPLGVALRGIELSGATAGDLAYVGGLGSIGLFTVAGLVDAGCRVLGADPREERRELALRMGCEAVIDPTREDSVGATLALDPHGPRLAFECSGVPDSLQQVFDTAGNEGVIGILGIPMAPAFLLRMTLRELRAFSIQGPSMASMSRALELLGRTPNASAPVTDVITLDELPGAFDALAEGRGGIKVLVSPGE